MSWDAVSSVAAVVAVVVSIAVWISQRRLTKRQVDIQERLGSIEEARREDELRASEQERLAGLVADVRVLSFRMERPGRSGDSDRVSITIENRGPSTARLLNIALKDNQDAAGGNHLGDAVELLDEYDGHSGHSQMGYFSIPGQDEVPGPINPGDQTTVAFWHRTRLFGNVGVRLEWEDGRGLNVSRVHVPFDPNPAGTH